MKIKETLNKLRTFPLAMSLGNIILLALILLAMFGTVILANRTSAGNETDEETAGAFDENCNVTGINLHGSLITYVPDHADGDTYFDYDVTASEDFIWTIKQANESDNIKAILIDVDSGGGSPVAGEEIASALTVSNKPIVAVIRDMGASSSYWAISSASRIFASKNSDVGGIGITMSYLDNVGKNKKDGHNFEQLSAGKYKDYGIPDKPLTTEERALFQSDIDTVYRNFIAAVAENRKLTIENVTKMADGASVLGEKAKSLGLIDEIGGMLEAEAYIEDTIGERPEICW